MVLEDANLGGKPGLGLTRGRYLQVAAEDERLQCFAYLCERITVRPGSDINGLGEIDCNDATSSASKKVVHFLRGSFVRDQRDEAVGVEVRQRRASAAASSLRA